MFKNRFSLETAYANGGRVVMNHFSFFLFAMSLGMLFGIIFFMMLGIVDFFALRYQIMPIFKMFQHIFCSATGPLHYAGFTVRDAVLSYIPGDIVSQALSRDVMSFDISGYNVAYILSWVLPTALVFKLLLDVISVGWTKIALDLKAGKTVSAHYLYKYYYLVPRVFVVNLVVWLATVVGFLLFIVPGVFIYQRLRFSKYFIIDKNLSIVKSLQSSWALTEGAVVQLFGFSMISLIIDSIGHLFLLLGFFTMPLQNQVEANVYMQLVVAR